MTKEETLRWTTHCHQHILSGKGEARSVAQFRESVENHKATQPDELQAIKMEVFDYVNKLEQKHKSNLLDTCFPAYWDGVDR
jgi:hypothetical protein